VCYRQIYSIADFNAEANSNAPKRGWSDRIGGLQFRYGVTDGALYGKAAGTRVSALRCWPWG
jgi:hypothetical protein